MHSVKQIRELLLILVGGSEFLVYDSKSGRQIRAFKLLDDASFSHDWND